MNLILQQQLNQELLRSERRRTIILIAILLCSSCYRAIDMVFVTYAGNEIRNAFSFQAVWLCPLNFILFELATLLYINMRLRKGKKQITLAMQYLNVAFEFCLFFFIVLWVVKHYPSFNVIQSPVVYVYFILIILSTLRLNFGLSFFSGVLSSLSYIIFCLLTYNHVISADGIKAIVILFCGIAAGMVARQIKAGVSRFQTEIEKRQQLANLFGKQVSKEIASKMLENNGMIESKRMDVAIMFIDIRNFTQYAASRTPEEIVQYQDSFFKIVINVIAKHDGVINQFIGDGCMVTFGAPLPLLNPSQKATNAAREILIELNNAITAGIISPTRIGIGIHTGEAVTGNIGTAARQQYTITGNVVILASRIEQLNKELQSQILVSEEVVKRIDRNNSEAKLYGPVSLKGYEKPISVYKLA